MVLYAHDRSCIYIYHRNNDSTPRVLTAEERERRDEERRETIRRYRAWRRSILQSRDQDRQFRNEEKLRQLKEAEKQQVHTCIYFTCCITTVEPLIKDSSAV